MSTKNYNTMSIPPIRKLEHTKTGTRPLFLSSAMAFFKVPPLREKFSSTGRNFTFTREIKPAFSTEECAFKKREAVRKQALRMNSCDKLRSYKRQWLQQKQRLRSLL